MDVVNGVWVAREAALGLLKQAVVPLHAIARLPLLHQHKACLQLSTDISITKGTGNLNFSKRVPSALRTTRSQHVQSSSPS